MATAISTHPPSATPKVKPPRPPSVSAGVAAPGPAFTSPSLANKHPPTSTTHQSSGAVIGSLNNGMVSRSTARQRREHGRAPNGSTQNGSNSAQDGPRGVKRKFGEPHVRTTEYILQKHAGSRPSLILHLHQTHFRFEQQDGSFGYNSPMKVFLDHLKAQTIPHDVLEELLNNRVVFYDGCLIVEIHDHKTGAGAMRNKSSGTVGSDQDVPYSIHNYNQHLTPSPYVPYPTQSQNGLADAASASSNGSADGNTSKADTNETKPKPDKSSHRVFTIVLHPTEQSKYREQCILASTPMPERPGRKGSAREAPTPMSANGSKPLLSLSLVNGKAAKRPRMYLEEKDFHDFEAEYLLATEPPLLLEPASGLEDAITIMEKLEHPLHTHQPAPAKGRKRTATELAADEAQAAEDERMSLIFDERLQPSLGTRGGDEGSDAANTARDFEPNFSRFKKFEEIKARLEEEKKQRAEAEAQAQIAKRQHQEQEAQRRQREEANQQKRDLQREIMKRQMVQRNGTQINGQLLNPLLVQQQMMQAQAQAQAQAAGSPIMRNQTPTNASSPLMNNAMNNQNMAHSMSTNSHGSPPRPGSVGNMRQMPTPQMARQVSQQQSQHGTPHMPHATPQMANNMPGRVTPQPGMNSGSPSQMQGTPMMGQGMMGTPQMNGQQGQMTTQQRQAYMQQQLAARSQAQQRIANQLQQQQQHMTSSPNPNQFGMQMSPQHMQQMMANQQQQHAQPNGQQMQGMGGNSQMTPQMAQQMAQQTAQQTAQQRQSAQYSAQMQARTRLMQMGNHGQSQPQVNGMANHFQQAQAQGGGMANGAQMQAPMSQHSQNGNPQAHFMQGGQASPSLQQQFQQQQAAGLTPQQQLARQHEQALKNQFMTRLMQVNGGMLPANANDRYASYRKSSHTFQQQATHRQAAVGGQGGMQMPGQGQGGGGVDPAYAAQLEQQRQLMVQQQMMRRQAANQQRMMNGMPPGQ